MFAVTVRFALKPGRAVPFLDLIGKNAAQPLADRPGFRRFDVCVSDELPGDTSVYEV